MRPAVFIAVGAAVGVAYWYMRNRASASNGAVGDGGFFDIGGVAGAVFNGGQAVNMRISFGGIELIKKFEGFRSRVYDANPPKQDWTIGYGHKLKSGESFPRGVTESEARKLLIEDVGFAENRVNKNITIRLNQSQFDALVSLAYNLTTKSWLAAAGRINNGESATSVFGRYVYAGGVKLLGLVTRRNDEIALYNGGNTGVA